MNEGIRPVTLEELDEVVRIAAMAYPGSNFLAPESRQRFAERVKDTLQNDPYVSFHGCFRDEKLVGIMRWHDYYMNVHGTKLLTGGIGLVAVDLLHKKEKVAKEMLLHFLNTYRDRGISLVSLYPFRVDFYKQMGFGTSTKMNQYSIKPSSLRFTGKEQIDYLGMEDKEEILACYHRIVRQTHGMITKTDREMTAFLGQPEQIVVGCRNNGRINGYLAFSFQNVHVNNRMHNNLIVKEFHYETREALAQLTSFLNSQGDQVHRIILTIQDDDFHFLLSDPSNGTANLLPSVYHESSVAGVGLMHRIIDVPLFFKQLSQHRFGRENALVRMTIRDTFLPEQDGSWLIRFTEGLPQVVDEGQAEVEVSMDISEFSSLMMGAVSFQKLYMYGLAEIDHEDSLTMLESLFQVRQKPRCTTAF
ncbi:GNAT family N-acetyltransferase [Brevibacillus invocatus]|uniref:GNAT family N-acetyltransferase n=2 Tax=Brevibacillus TaxID=55080 RepID=A0A3M8C7M9_9BACL|nr:GNAT family N-acetyltransferase [Brevibacillus sp. AY1]RNB71658.1 GNAT family N-acetyltransferase [Brevibacillus invocatus]